MSARVLVVEDDEALRKTEVIFLRKFGFEVYDAANGALGVELFERAAEAGHPIEAVVLDGMMPVMDGFEACEKIRAHAQGGEIPILMVTGMNENEALERAYKAGASDFILKPVNFNVLSHRLKHLVEKLRLQNELVSERCKLEAFFQTIPTAVIFCDGDFKILSINPAAEALFGWGSELVADLPLDALFAEAAESENIKKRLREEGKLPPLLEHRFATADEKDFWGELMGQRVGSDLGYALVVSDVTQKRKLQQEKEKDAKLELVGLLAGGIAHDFNNILAALYSTLDLARLEVEENSRAWKALLGARPALDQAKRLSGQLLTFSKGGAPVRKLCDMERIARQAVEFSLRGSRVLAEFDTEKGLWPADVDEGQVVQVLSNLVVNAVQAMPQGGHLRVCLGNCVSEGSPELKDGNYLRLSVSDEGCGIEEALLKKIFDPYFTTKASGNGLGLATVLSIVRRHGGCVRVASQMGKGSTFETFWPAQALHASVGFAPKGEAKPNRKISKTCRVLLLEDQELIRAAMVPLLQKAGCTVVACETGAEAVQAYRNEKGFDVAILDMTLPGGMNGLETLKELRKIDANVRAIVSTGYADDPVMADPERYGFCGVLPKPYTFEELVAAVEMGITQPVKR